jgi:outer membrane protein OmpA-like peptidoglycan-associated protein
MRHQFLWPCSLLLVFLLTTFRGNSQQGLAVGDQLKENIRFNDTSEHTVLIKIPNDTALLFYRYRGNAWFSDNGDSLDKIESIAGRLSSTSKAYRPLKVVAYAFNKDNFLTGSMKKNFRIGEGYTIDFYFLSDRNSSRITQGNKLLLVNKKGKVLAVSPSIADYRYIHKEEIRRLRAKLLTEKNGRKVPLVNAKVYLHPENISDSTPVVKTNKYGDFELNLPESMEDAALRVEPEQKNVKTIILATQEGIERNRLQRYSTIYEYKLIPADIIRLSDMYVEEDIRLGFKTFMGSKDKEFRRSEFINYTSGSYSIADDSKKILDLVAMILTDNPTIRLEVISHTDSQGDDKYNLELSEKRSLSVVSYLILIGVHPDRLTFIGKGESEIRNRCTNGVDCSDAEHRYNRRTEFRFLRE